MMQKKLTDAEWKVMEILWEASPRTMMEITNSLNGSLTVEYQKKYLQVA